MDIVYKEIPPEDIGQIRALAEEVMGGLERPEFLAGFKEKDFERIFDKDFVLSDGAYVDGRLVGMAQMFISQDTERKYGDMLGLGGYKVCSLGRNLVLKEFRGHGIMFRLITIQAEKAQRMGFEYIFSTVHPDNMASIKSLEKLGLKKAKTITAHGGLLRELMYMKLDSSAV